LCRKRAGPTATDPATILGRISLLQRALKERPQLWVPEMQWRADSDRLRLIERGPSALGNLDTEEGVRRALSLVRETAKSKFASRPGGAVESYTSANGGSIPGVPSRQPIIG
jgi:hypothetical protein